MTYSIWLEPTPKAARYLGEIIQEFSKNYNAPIFDPYITFYSGIAKHGKAKAAVIKYRISKMRQGASGLDTLAIYGKHFL